MWTVKSAAPHDMRKAVQNSGDVGVTSFSPCKDIGPFFSDSTPARSFLTHTTLGPVPDFPNLYWFHFSLVQSPLGVSSWTPANLGPRPLIARTSHTIPLLTIRFWISFRISRRWSISQTYLNSR